LRRATFEDSEEEAEMHNPLRSEAEMFRIVVVVGLFAVPVIVLGLAVSATAGGILLLAELVVAGWLLWDRTRGVEPHEAEVAAGGDGVYRLLVVANETVGGRALLSEIESRSAGKGRSEILVVVPVLAPSRLAHLAHDVDDALGEAQARLDHSLRTMASAGLKARGYVGDHHDPNTAIEDALREFAADEVIVSTHPPERSRWLEGGVVDRARRDIPLPVTHVVVDLKAEEAAAPA
jgi:hypothetical protein